MSIYTNYPKLKRFESIFEKTINLLVKTYLNGGKLLICGNGGSAADSMHIVGELHKGFCLKRKLDLENQADFMDKQDGEYLFNNLQDGYPAISLVSEAALLSAISNDNGFDLSFAQQVWTLGQEKDILLAISTSGNSRNVVLAAEVAKIKKMTVIGLTGEKIDTKLKKYSDIYINVPENETYRVQELHLPIYHFLCKQVEQRLFK